MRPEPNNVPRNSKTEVVKRMHINSRSEKRWGKRELKRARRRAEKRDPENAPTRMRELTQGWAD